MNKNKSITLLSVIGVVMAILFFFTFARFEIGVKNYNSVLGAIDTDYDLSGGTAFTLELAKDNLSEVKDVKKVTDTIGTRLEKLGYDVYKVVAYKDATDDVKDYNIRVELKAPLNEYGEPDANALQNDMQVVTAFGDLTFFGGSTTNPTDEILADVDNIVEKSEYAGSYVDGSTSIYQVSIKFSEEAFDVLKEKMAEGTFYLKINLGENTLLSGSEALTESLFTDRTIFISTGSEAQAKQFALQMSSGALAHKYEIVETEKITSPYGENVLKIALITLFAVIALFTAFVVVKYKGFAIVSLLSILLFTVIELWMLVLIPNVRLSMGGLIGFGFALTLTAFGFMIMFKNIQEEYAKGKTLKFAVTTGYMRTIRPVLTFAIIGAIISILSYVLGFGIIKNFAVCFGAGVVISIISVLLFGKMFISLILPFTKNNGAFYNLKQADATAKVGE